MFGVGRTTISDSKKIGQTIEVLCWKQGIE